MEVQNNESTTPEPKYVKNIELFCHHFTVNMRLNGFIHYPSPMANHNVRAINKSATVKSKGLKVPKPCIKSMWIAFLIYEVVLVET